MPPTATQRIRDKHIEENLAALKMKEMQHYCEVFRQYGLIAGDLLDRWPELACGYMFCAGATELCLLKIDG